jgi:hypothetical protein
MPFYTDNKVASFFFFQFQYQENCRSIWQSTFFFSFSKFTRKLGDITAKHRWFAALYIIVVFFIIPLAFFLLSQIGIEVVLAAAGAVVFIIVLLIIIKALRKN